MIKIKKDRRSIAGVIAKGTTPVEIILQGKLSAPAEAAITLATAAAGRA